jgi:hypothetical protein
MSAIAREKKEGHEPADGRVRAVTDGAPRLGIGEARKRADAAGFQSTM